MSPAESEIVGDPQKGNRPARLQDG